MLTSVLVANRGEIAVRDHPDPAATGHPLGRGLLRARRRLRATSARPTRPSCIGPASLAESYLDVERIVGAAAAHRRAGRPPWLRLPLREHRAGRRPARRAGIVFVGPPRGDDRADGRQDRGQAGGGRARASPRSPASHRARAERRRPGRGRRGDRLPGAGQALGRRRRQGHAAARGRAGHLRPRSPRPAARPRAAFGDDTLFVERYLPRPRHIEVQVLADAYGTVLHLGERECSLQRRHQKIIEEAPSPLLDAATRAAPRRRRRGRRPQPSATSAPGTVEFIVTADEPDEFYFMEMNTRLQVEHPVTEEVRGLDLVEWQLRIAAGETLSLAPGRRHDPTGTPSRRASTRRTPRPASCRPVGRCWACCEPSGPLVRVESGLSVGMTIGSDFDPMLSKVIAYGPDRATALRTLDRALSDTAVLGVGTNVEFLRFLLADDDVAAGRLDTGLIDRTVFTAEPPGDETFVAAAAYRWLQLWADADADLWDVPTGWRLGEPAPTSLRLRSGARTDHVHITGTPGHAVARVEDGETRSLSAQLSGDVLAVTIDGLRATYTVATAGHQIWLAGAGPTVLVEEVREAPVRPDDAHSGDAELAQSHARFGCRRWCFRRADRDRGDGGGRRRGDEDGAFADRAGRRRRRASGRRRRPGQGGPAVGQGHSRHKRESNIR